MRELLTPKQVARAIGVSEASLKRWCDRGLIPATRTAGGHRRLPLAGVIDYLRKSRRPLVRPEVLGLPPTSGRTEAVLDRAVGRFVDALEAGDEERIRCLLIDLHLAGHTVDAIGDRVIAPAFRIVGEHWEVGTCEVYQERRACEISQRGLYYLSAIIAPAIASAPFAIGGTLQGDPYALPTLLVELTLRQAGWRAASFGSNLPAATLCAALRRTQPRLLWLSASHIDDADAFVAAYEQVFATALELGVVLAVGGQALTDAVRQQIRYATHCDTLGQLVTFTAALYEPPPTPAEPE
mgnify:CR=1 FL=1